MVSMELEQVFSAYTDATWVLKEDGTVIRANNAMLKMLERTDYEVVGKKCFDLMDDHLCDKRSCPRVGLEHRLTSLWSEREGTSTTFSQPHN